MSRLIVNFITSFGYPDVMLDMVTSRTFDNRIRPLERFTLGSDDDRVRSPSR